MPLSKIFKRILLPCAAGVTAAENFGPVCERKSAAGTRPSDLPIYSKPCSDCEDIKDTTSPPSSMEEAVGKVRRELWVWQDNFKGYRHKIVDVYRNGFSKANCPGAAQSRNRLEQSFQDSEPDQCEESPTKGKPGTDLKGFRSPWAVTRQLENFCVDRCGKPCSGTQCRRKNHNHRIEKSSQDQQRDDDRQHDCPQQQHQNEHKQQQSSPECKEQEPQHQEIHQKEPHQQLQYQHCQKHRPHCPVPQPKHLGVKGQHYPPCEGPSNQQDHCTCCQNAHRVVVDYLREEAHGPQRIGAIGLSGMAGYILGMRRGIIRRVFYGCTGALGMAVICYPNEAVNYLESIVLETRRYFIVAYHFIYGETPQMPGWLEKLTGDLGLAVEKSDNVKTEGKSNVLVNTVEAESGDKKKKEN